MTDSKETPVELGPKPDPMAGRRVLGIVPGAPVAGERKEPQKDRLVLVWPHLLVRHAVAAMSILFLVMVLAVCTLITFLTELTSNTATTQVLLPIIASLSTVVDLPPLVLMVPATMAASCAFMLPVATPPNAIVFGTHRIQIREMAAVGIRLNLISIIVITLAVYALGLLFF